MTNLGTAEYFMTILDDELDSVVSGLHVCHLALEAVVTHDRGREDYSKIFGGHLYDISMPRSTRHIWEHTRFSLFLRATRARWKIKNSKQSRCFCGSRLNVCRRCAQRS